MLEILCVWFLSRKMSDFAGSKGRSNVPYVLLFIALWFGGEIAGAVFGAARLQARGDEQNVLAILPFAYGGALLGTALAFGFVAILPAVRDDEPEPYRRRRPRRRREIDEDDYEAPPRRRRIDDDEDRPRRRGDRDVFQRRRDF
jgi:hypothetical protein